MHVPPDTHRDLNDGRSATQDGRRGPFNRARLAPLLIIMAFAVLVLAMGWHRYLSLEALARHRALLDGLIGEHYLAALLGYMALYIGIVALSLPGAAVLTIAGGLLFGWVIAGFVVVAAATAGATIVFLLARGAFGEFFLGRAGPGIAKVVHGFRSEAFSYLLFLRLVPLFPFVLVNLAAAIAAIPLMTFVGATALGIIPGTFVFAAVGSGLDSVLAAQSAQYNTCLSQQADGCRIDFDPSAALTPQLLAGLTALGLLALLPILAKKFYPRRPRARLPD